MRGPPLIARSQLSLSVASNSFSIRRNCKLDDSYLWVTITFFPTVLGVSGTQCWKFLPIWRQPMLALAANGGIENRIDRAL